MNDMKNDVFFVTSGYDVSSLFLLGGSSHLVVNNHGDRFRPLSVGLWDPFQIGRTSWLINGGDPDHHVSDRPGMILPPQSPHPNKSKISKITNPKPSHQMESSGRTPLYKTKVDIFWVRRSLDSIWVIFCFFLGGCFQK